MYLLGYFSLQFLYIDGQFLIEFLELDKSHITRLLSRLSLPNYSAHFLRVLSTANNSSSIDVITLLQIITLKHHPYSIKNSFLIGLSSNQNLLYFKAQMAEENIWKKQAQLNRMKAEGKNQSSATNNNVPAQQYQPSSPINAFIKNNNNSTPSPPWAKSSAPSNTPSQAPWAKTSNPPADTNSGQPSWMNKANNQPINAVQSANQSSSQPPWAKNNTASQPPWAKSNTQTQPAAQSTQPPWAKNSTTASNQPPWARGSEGQIRSQESISQPPWAKSAQQIEGPSKQAESGNQPPWARNNDNASKPNRVSGESSSSNSNPPWMKRESPEVQRNSWKMKQSQEIERQKQDLQEQMRRQEEEERQRKRIQKEKKEKEIQQANQLRQILRMQKEQEYSVARERFDREELQRREREQKEEQQRRRKEEERLRQEEERKRLEQQQSKRLQEIERLEEEARRREAEEQQRRQKERIVELDRSSKTSKSKQKSKKTTLSKRKKKQLLQSSKISHISSIKGLEQMNNLSENDPLPENLYRKYLRLINQETTEYDYKKKIQLQQHLYQLHLQCRRECQKEIRNLFSSKKVTNRKRKFFFCNSLQIQYALCQGKKGQNGLYFDNEEAQELKTKFLQYQVLTRCVLNLMKKKINLHLRVPLINYAEHKGISFLVEHVSQELIDIIEIQIALFQQIANEVLVFEKELELAQEEHSELKPITKDMLMAKKITINQQDYYILYIKSGKKAVKIKSHSNSNALLSKLLPKFNHLNDLSLLQLIIGQNTLLPYYQVPLQMTKEAYEQMQKVSAPALRKIAYNLCRARAIHTVYSSCQGEVEEQSFFQLVLEGNKEIWDMIVAAGSPDRNPPEPIVLAYLQSLSSVKFKFQHNMITRKKKTLIQRVEPAVFIQRYDYELLEFIKNFDKYVSEDKEDLVEQSMSLSRQLFQDISQGQPHSQFNFLRIKNEVSYLLYKHNENEALEQIERGRETVGKLSLQSIPLNILALKIYIAKDMEVAMLKTLSELLQTLEFYFGEESMLHALVYTAVGIYYSKKNEQPQAAHEQKVITFYEHSLSITLKLYGEKAQEVADIYLSRAIAFINLGRYDNFSKDIQQALKIYKMHSKSGPRIAECNHLMGRVKCKQNQMAQGIQLMELGSNQYMKMYNHIESLCILFEILPYLQNNQTQLEVKIQQIVEICFTYKSIWAFKRIATTVLDRELNCYTSLNIQSLQELFHPLDHDDRTNEEVLIDLEEEIKGFSSFIQIVRWALSIIAGKMAARREVTGDQQKAHNIIGEVLHFYGKSQGISMDLRDSQLL